MPVSEIEACNFTLYPRDTRILDNISSESIDWEKFFIVLCCCFSFNSVQIMKKSEMSRKQIYDRAPKVGKPAHSCEFSRFHYTVWRIERYPSQNDPPAKINYVT